MPLTIGRNSVEFLISDVFLSLILGSAVSCLRIGFSSYSSIKGDTRSDSGLISFSFSGLGLKDLTADRSWLFRLGLVFFNFSCSASIFSVSYFCCSYLSLASSSGSYSTKCALSSMSSTATFALISSSVGSLISLNT